MKSINDIKKYIKAELKKAIPNYDKIKKNYGYSDSESRYISLFYNDEFNNIQKIRIRISGHYRFATLTGPDFNKKYNLNIVVNFKNFNADQYKKMVDDFINDLKTKNYNFIKKPKKIYDLQIRQWYRNDHRTLLIKFKKDCERQEFINTWLSDYKNKIDKLPNGKKELFLITPISQKIINQVKKIAIFC